MKEVQIGTLAHASPHSFKIGPFGSSLKKDELVNHGIPVAGIENVLPNHFLPKFRKFITKEKFSELSDYEVQPGDVLVSTMGTIGRAAVVPDNIGTVIIDSHLFRMRVDKSKVYPPYLCYAINGYTGLKQQLTRMARGAIMEGLNTTILKECLIPLPPEKEQKRIAAILDKVNRLHHTRHYAEQLSGTILQSVFLEMFGDPATNPSDWPLLVVEELLSKHRAGIRTGPFGSSLKKHEYVKDGIPVWGINNVKENEFIEDKPLYITKAKYKELTNYTVKVGDILISRAGTVGRMCIARPTRNPSIIGTNLVRVALKSSLLLPEYFTALFTYFPSRVGRLRTSNDVNAYSFLNPNILKTLSIPVPPIDLQRKYSVAVKRFERLRAQQREATRQAEHLFQTLLRSAFRGEL